MQVPEFQYYSGNMGWWYTDNLLPFWPVMKLTLWIISTSVEAWHMKLVSFIFFIHPAIGAAAVPDSEGRVASSRVPSAS